MKKLGANKVISKRLGISAVVMFISMLALFATIGFFQNASLAQAADKQDLSASADKPFVDNKKSLTPDTANADCLIKFTTNTAKDYPDAGYLEIEDGDHKPVETLTVPSGST